MNRYYQSFFLGQIDNFLDYLGIDLKPQVYFVEKVNLKECLIDARAEDAIAFNLSFFENLSPLYSLLIMIHEVYHYSIQNIKSKSDVNHIRDIQEWTIMQLTDVEADLETVKYLASLKLIKSFDHYCRILHLGSQVFRDEIMRVPKLERFIGSTVSIKSYFDNRDKVLYLPKLCYGSLVLQTFDFDRSRICYHKISQIHCNLDMWQIVYHNATDMKKHQYAISLERLAANFLKSVNGNPPSNDAMMAA